VTEAEFALRTARALLSTHPDKAANFVNRALSITVDPRLRVWVRPILTMLKEADIDAAGRWLERALSYEQSRRAGRH
jgi:hypothetical protein